MSIILKGIDIPKETKEMCVMYKDKEGYLQTCIVKDIIQIPNGVRLIDANKLWENMLDGMDIAGYQSWIMDVIVSTPPILESEEE